MRVASSGTGGMSPSGEAEAGEDREVREGDAHRMDERDTLPERCAFPRPTLDGGFPVCHVSGGMQDTKIPIATGAAILAMAAQGSAQSGEVIPGLLPFISQVTGEFQQIPVARRQILQEAASFLRAKLHGGEPAEITFICTHNSRRSHLGQIWAQTASAYYGLSGVRTFSGGTEATACNERTVAALMRGI